LCLLNKAATHLKLKKYEKAISDCNEVLILKPTNLKAFFRRGGAYLGLKKFEEAKSDLERAHEISPDDTTVQQANVISFF